MYTYTYRTRLPTCNINMTLAPEVYCRYLKVYTYIAVRFRPSALLLQKKKQKIKNKRRHYLEIQYLQYMPVGGLIPHTTSKVPYAPRYSTLLVGT